VRECSDDTLETLLALHGIVYRLDQGFWVKFKAYRVPPSEQIPHGIAYSLTLHDQHNDRVFGIDNAHAYQPKRKKYGGRKVTWDHRHNREKILPYEFESAAQLLADFWREVEKILS
jgi:hypothetical protein